MSNNNEVDTVCAEIFKTLANPVRIKIISLLEKNELTVSELVRLTGQKQSSISQHLALLRQRGFIKARRGGVNVYYRLVNPRVAELCKLAREILYDSLKKRETLARSIGALARS